jgi:methylenetetrahydrofolate--tRNA-(uracil-5-)-methyltransferase
MNINFGLFPPVEGRMKKANRKQAYTARARADLAAWLAELSVPRSSRASLLEASAP